MLIATTIMVLTWLSSDYITVEKSTTFLHNVCHLHISCYYSGTPHPNIRISFCCNIISQKKSGHHSNLIPATGLSHRRNAIHLLRPHESHKLLWLKELYHGSSKFFVTSDGWLNSRPRYQRLRSSDWLNSGLLSMHVVWCQCTVA